MFADPKLALPRPDFTTIIYFVHPQKEKKHTDWLCEFHPAHGKLSNSNRMHWCEMTTKCCSTVNKNPKTHWHEWHEHVWTIEAPSSAWNYGMENHAHNMRKCIQNKLNWTQRWLHLTRTETNLRCTCTTLWSCLSDAKHATVRPAVVGKHTSHDNRTGVDKGNSACIFSWNCQRWLELLFNVCAITQFTSHAPPHQRKWKQTCLASLTRFCQCKSDLGEFATNLRSLDAWAMSALWTNQFISFHNNFAKSCLPII